MAWINQFYLSMPASLILIVRFNMRFHIVSIGLSMICEFASAAEAPSANCPSSIHISAGNSCRIDEIEVSCDSLGVRLKAIPVASTCDVHITVDKSSTYEVVRRALESIRKAGYLRVGFVNDANP